ncbi:MAG: hypothetical protein K2N64_01720 [Anaeroplasmataceae bacterium]|nr:hypothetical protein [Anaeroplasmataceae bacterium]
MKKRINIITGLILIILSMLWASSCTSAIAIDNEPEKPVTGNSEALVVYFSWSGNTQILANIIAEKRNADLFRIVPEVPYTNEDVFSRAQEELNNGVRPPLAEHIDHEIMDRYEIIYIGFPVWWYDLPMPVWSFLEEYDFSGKTIVPFFSHNGSSSGASSISTIRRLCPNSTIIERYLSIRGSNVNSAEADVIQWINNLNI